MNFDPYQVGYQIIMNAYHDANLATAYGKIATFLHQNPESIASRKKNTVTLQDFLCASAKAFVDGRQRNVSLPKTLSDERIKDVLNIAYKIPDHKLDEAIHYHREGMAAENIMGWLLESYIASEAERHDWVWCSGGIVKAIDFIQPLTDNKWNKLQIKNRSNTENSASNKIRKGTDIKIWFRIDAYTGQTFWNDFPDPCLSQLLSEHRFRDYIVFYFSQQLSCDNSPTP